MKRRCLIVILIVVSLTAIFVYIISTSFDPVYDNAEIKQNIGGKLICNSVYISDHHSWQYNVTYKYKHDDGSIIDIGDGTYYGREWDKDEQLIEYKTWTILKTGGGNDTDKLIIGNLNTRQWKEYEFTPHNIEVDSLWLNSNIISESRLCCATAFIEKISNGQVILNYRFRTSEKNVDAYSQRNIYYTIDSATGEPIMTRIN